MYIGLNNTKRRYLRGQKQLKSRKIITRREVLGATMFWFETTLCPATVPPEYAEQIIIQAAGTVIQQKDFSDNLRSPAHISDSLQDFCVDVDPSENPDDDRYTACFVLQGRYADVPKLSEVYVHFKVIEKKTSKSKTSEDIPLKFLDNDNFAVEIIAEKGLPVDDRLSEPTPEEPEKLKKSAADSLAALKLLDPTINEDDWTIRSDDL